MSAMIAITGQRAINIVAATITSKIRFKVQNRLLLQLVSRLKTQFGCTTALESTSVTFA